MKMVFLQHSINLVLTETIKNTIFGSVIIQKASFLVVQDFVLFLGREHIWFQEYRGNYF